MSSRETRRVSSSSKQKLYNLAKRILQEFGIHLDGYMLGLLWAYIDRVSEERAKEIIKLIRESLRD